MRWSPGPISQDIEDRRFDSPELLLARMRAAAERGDPMAQQEVPPWMDTRPSTQEAAVGGQDDPAVLAFLRMLGGQ